MKTKQSKKKGEMDYDYKQDILFFKSAEKEYAKSIELDDYVLDLDKENHVIGIQIFEASKFLNISKKALLKIPHWEFEVKVNDGKIEIRLIFQVEIRNKIIEKNPIIMQTISRELPNSIMVCEA